MANLYKNINSGTSSYSSSPLKKLELQNAHEQVQLKEQHEHEERMADMQYRHEANLNNQALGCFGRIFGSQENNRHNMFIVCCRSNINFSYSIFLQRGYGFCKKNVGSYMSNYYIIVGLSFW